MLPASLPAADAAARIDALENEVRRLSTQLHDESQSARREITEIGNRVAEMGNRMTEISSRAWQLWEKVWSHEGRMKDSDNRITAIEQYK